MLSAGPENYVLKQARNVTVFWKSGLEGEGDASPLPQAAYCDETGPVLSMAHAIITVALFEETDLVSSPPCCNPAALRCRITRWRTFELTVHGIELALHHRDVAKCCAAHSRPHDKP